MREERWEQLYRIFDAARQLQSQDRVRVDRSIVWNG